jgi:hypothetical protein
MLGQIAMLIVAGAQAMDNGPWLQPGSMLWFSLGVLVGPILLYLLFDLFAKYALSKSKMPGAYEYITMNVQLAYAFKTTVCVAAIMTVVAFGVYAGRNGLDFVVPLCGSAPTCLLHSRWLDINGYAALAALFMFFYAWRTLPVYVSEDIRTYDVWDASGRPFPKEL